ncbi:chromate transporter [Flavobacterium sp. 1]|uniref:chromate transporter n=1 Tax=Flavobacterium sp. 1 TaxID=2035200 RepID=UPI000CB71534|nr:chromate transporter [Flavobacterium sp. 1]PJJ11013.1 chromate transporter [Flavobacterium sp. 1]
MKENPTYTLKELAFYFLKLGTIGFGGPVALVGYMYKDLVENRKWISEECMSLIYVDHKSQFI